MREANVNRQVMTGLIMIVAGLAISIGSYVAASDGGTYMVLWGLPLFGVVNVVKGLTGRR
jgi:hypothetical protein